jgi:hypothetical protein
MNDERTPTAEPVTFEGPLWTEERKRWYLEGYAAAQRRTAEVEWVMPPDDASIGEVRGVLADALAEVERLQAVLTAEGPQ